MVTTDHVIKVPISSAYAWIAAYYAERAQIGGVSQIREGEERAEMNPTDQMVGQVAQLAFCLYHFGDIHHYRVSRWHADRNPTKGDGGFDIPGLNLDVKGGGMRQGDDIAHYLKKYRLPVRPRERHRGFVYVHVLVALDWTAAYLIGWMDEASLPSEVDRDGPLKGCFTYPSGDLNPLLPLYWWRQWRE